MERILQDSVSGSGAIVPLSAAPVDEISVFLAEAQTRLDHVYGTATSHQSVSAEAPLEIDVFQELQVSLEELRVAHEELLNAREDVEEERLRYQDLFEFAPDGYLLTDVAGLVLEANTAALQLLGTTSVATLNKPLILFIAQRSRRAFRSLLLRAARADKVSEWQGEMVRADGRPFVGSVTVLYTGAYRKGEAQVRTLRWMLRDVTEFWRGEEALRGQTAALTRTLNALASAPLLDTFLQQVLSELADQLMAQWITLWFRDNQEQTWVLRLSHDAVVGPIGDPTDAQSIPAYESPLWEELLYRRRPVVVHDVFHDLRTPDHAAWLASGVRSVMLAPMLLGEQIFGALRLRSAQPKVYTREEIEMVQALAQQATLALQMARLAEQQQQSVVLEERNRMAREIHDTLAQGFTGITIQLEAAEDALADAPQRAQFHLARARELARYSLNEARRSVQALRPELLVHRDLAGAMAQVVAEITAGGAADVRFHVSGEPCPLPPDVEDQLLRIGQEAMANALKHGQPRRVDTTLAFDDDAVRLCVKDDGRGFDVQRMGDSHGMGLRGMSERAERVGMGRTETCVTEGDLGRSYTRRQSA